MKKIHTDVKEIQHTDEIKQQISQISRQNQALCLEGQKAFLICVTSGCLYPAFLCNQEQCACQKNHENCSLKKISYLFQKISNKINTKAIVETHDKKIKENIAIYENLIQSLHRQRQKCKQYLTENINQQTFLSQKEKNIYRLIKNKETDKISGDQLYQFQKQLKTPSKQLQKVEHFWKSLKGGFGYNTEVLINKISQLKNIYKISHLNMFTQASKVIQNEAEAEILNKLTGNKILYLKLLYRASQNGFKIKEFKKKCVGFPNTLMLAQTNKNAKIGGYSYLQWKINNNSDNCVSKVAQPKIGEQNAFLFSITDNFIQSPMHIFNLQNFGPCFDKRKYQGLKNQSTLFNLIQFGISQQNYSKLPQNDRQPIICSYTKKLDPKSKQIKYLGGSQQFYLNQWQIWKIVFKSK